MYVTTRLRSPKFPYEVLRNMCQVSFVITQAQLTELLITLSLKHEMPELEQEHSLLQKQKVGGKHVLFSMPFRRPPDDGCSRPPYIHPCDTPGPPETVFALHDALPTPSLCMMHSCNSTLSLCSYHKHRCTAWWLTEVHTYSCMYACTHVLMHAWTSVHTP